MITKIYSLPKCDKHCHPALVRIFATHSAYNGMDGYSLYQQNEKMLISCLDGATVLFGEATDNDELNAFLKFSAKNVFCSKSVATGLDLIVKKQVNIMKKQGFHSRYILEKFPPFSTREIHSALKNGEDGDINAGEYEAFAADFSLRWRRGVAYGVLIENTACALSFNVTDTAAFINGVAVKREMRGTGLGKQAVTELCKRLGERDVFVGCTDRVIGFYKSMDFKKIDDAVYCDII